MKGAKRFCALLLTVCLLLTMAPIALAANGTIIMDTTSNKMTVNGASVAIDTDPAIKPQVKSINGNGYTMLPLRAIVESMGGTVAYNTATKVITMTYKGNTVLHTIGTKTATVNGVSKPMEIESYAANNRTYVHLRAIELLNSDIKVSWNASAPTKITITYPQATTPTTPAPATKTVSLTIKNAASNYLSFAELKLAPAGTTNFSSNLLTDTLVNGGTRTLTLAIAPGKYDLRGVDINGNIFNWTNLDFTKVEKTAYLTLTSGSMHTLSIDSTLTGTATANVTIANATGASIKNIAISNTTAATTAATNMFTGTLYTGNKTTFAVPYETSAPYFSIVVTFTTGNTLIYTYVNLGAAAVTVNLRGDGTFTYGSTGSTSSEYKEGLYLYNDSDIDFKEFYVINADLIDTSDYDHDFETIDEDMTEKEIAEYFEDHDAAKNSKKDDYDASDFWKKFKNFDDRDEVFTDAWELDELERADLLFYGLDDKGQEYYGLVTIGKASNFDYNVYIEILFDDDEDYDYDLFGDVDYDYKEKSSSSNNGHDDDEDDDDEMESGLIIYNNTGSTINKVYISTDDDFLDSDYEIDDKNAKEETFSNLKDGKYVVSSKFDDYKKDIKGVTFYYYVEFKTGEDAENYGGEFESNKSNKQNFCLILNGEDEEDEPEWDWEEEEGQIYFFNDTGETLTEIKVRVTKSDSFVTAYKGTVKDGKTVELDFDLEDVLDEEYIEIKVYYDDGDESEKDSLEIDEDDLDKDGDLVLEMDDNFELDIA